MPDVQQCRDFAEICGQDVSDIKEANRRLKTASVLLKRFMDDRQSTLVIKTAEAAEENRRFIGENSQHIGKLTERVDTLTELVIKLTEQVTAMAAVKAAPKPQKDKPVKSAKQSAPKKKYGEYGNVLLTDAQYASLVNKLGEKMVLAYIDDVDVWCQQQNKSYSDYAAAVRNFYKRDEKAGKLKSPVDTSEHSYNLDKLVEFHTSHVPTFDEDGNTVYK